MVVRLIAANFLAPALVAQLVETVVRRNSKNPSQCLVVAGCFLYVAKYTNKGLLCCVLCRRPITQNSQTTGVDHASISFVEVGNQLGIAGTME